MIKKLFIVALAFVAVSAQAQVGKKMTAGKGTPVAKITNPNTTASALDTLFPATLDPSNMSACGLQVGGSVYYQLDGDAVIDTGFAFGTNSQPFVFGGITYTIELIESAQKYNVSGAATITGVLFGAGVANSSNPNTVVTSVIYSEDGTTFGPSASALGTSNPMQLSTVSTTGLNMLTFGSAIPVNNQDFFVSIVAPKFVGTDTLAIISTTFGCSSADSLSWTREIATGPGGVQVLNQWYSVKYLFGGNLDLWQFPVINNTTNSSVTRGDLTMFAATPNPAVNTINLNFSLNTSSTVQVDIMDVTGKLIKSVKNADTFGAGKHAVELDVTGLEAGSYLYSINACGTRMVSKFVVAK